MSQCIGVIMFDYDNLPVCLAKLKKKMQKIFCDVLKPFDLSSVHAMYLVVLCKNGGQTLKQLSDKVAVNRANTTRVVSDLMTKGYIYNDRSDENQRKYKVFLTAEGESVASNIIRSMEQRRKVIVTKFTEAEAEQLMFLLQKLIEED